MSTAIQSSSASGFAASGCDLPPSAATTAAGQLTPTSSALPQRSTRGASKQRRDQINVEIQRLRDLLPLSESIKDRLFQLQVMSLGCIFIRKHHYQQHVLRSIGAAPSAGHLKGVDMCKALRGFMMMMTRNGKILHVSENASEYLGHSVEEIMCQGDSIYDLVDLRDHAAVQAELASGPPSTKSFPEERVFICRLNLARTAKRQLQYHKFILLQGRYIHPCEYYQTPMGSSEATQPVFAAYCQPLINPENAESLSTGNTNVFCTQHFLDMKFKEVDSMSCHHLGYSYDQLVCKSWYQMLHPLNVPEVAYKHKLLCQDKEGSVLALIRLQTASGDWIWLHTVFAVRGNFAHEVNSEGRRVRHVIYCFHQVLSDLEAATLQANSWIYSMRHTYPTAFACQDSPQSDDRPLSPASPFNAEFGAPVCDPFAVVKQERFLAAMPPPFSMGCEQIKVEIPMKQMPHHLSLFTPESSSPESSASLNSLLFSSHFNASSSSDTSSLLDEILPAAAAKTALPELRDEVDEFLRQVEQADDVASNFSSHPPRQLQMQLPQMGPPPQAQPRFNHQQAELYKYLGPALFANPAFNVSQPCPPLSDPHMFHHIPHQPMHDYYSRKRSWAV